VKILIARLNHETNTFSPVPTTLADFAPLYGEDALRDQRHARTAMAAMIQAAQDIPGVTLVTPVCAMANPSGTVAASAYTDLCQSILDQVPSCDAIMLDLHGALVAENAADGEGELLEKIRALAPTTPIAVALDLHANVTQKMVDHADILLRSAQPKIKTGHRLDSGAAAVAHAQKQHPRGGNAACCQSRAGR